MSTHLGGRVLVAHGDTTYDEPLRVTSPIEDGLRILVVLDGAMQIRADDTPPLSVDGPTNLAVLSDGACKRDQLFHEGRPFRCVLVQIDRDLVATESGIDPSAVLERSSGGRRTSRIMMNARPSDPGALAIAAQIRACPAEPSFDLFRLAKALELTSLVLEGFDGSEAAGRRAWLSPAECERVREARAFLLAAPDEHHDLKSLAVHAGMNPVKLARGFRALYGATPHAVLQEHRLQAAYRMLASAQRSVGETAAATGYSPAHFATLFRRRFGVSPRALLRKRCN